ELRVQGDLAFGYGGVAGDRTHAVGPAIERERYAGRRQLGARGGRAVLPRPAQPLLLTLRLALLRRFLQLHARGFRDRLVVHLEASLQRLDGTAECGIDLDDACGIVFDEGDARDGSV